MNSYLAEVQEHFEKEVKDYAEGLMKKMDFNDIVHCDDEDARLIVGTFRIINRALELNKEYTTEILSISAKVDELHEKLDKALNK